MKIKNSNKVLLLVLFLALSIPLLVAMVLRHKVLSGQFEIVHATRPDENPALQQRGALDGAKFVKVTGLDGSRVGPEALKVIILHNEDNTFLLQKKQKADSILVQPLGDTLCFHYYVDTTGKKKEPYYRNYNYLTLVLNLPKGTGVYGDNCVIQFTADRENAGLSKNDPVTCMYLINHARLEIGNKDISFAPYQILSEVEKKSSVVVDSSEASRRHFDSTYASMGRLQVSANNSTVRVIQPVNFSTLAFQLENHSFLELPHPFKTDQLSGHLDADTEIKGNFGGLKRIKSLMTD